MSPEQAKKMGYDPVSHAASVDWKPMPESTYHATTNMPAVLAEGLKTREQLGQTSGAGLGGGEPSLSFTTDKGMASDVLSGFKVMHAALTGDDPVGRLMGRAVSGEGADKPFDAPIAEHMTTAIGKNWKQHVEHGTQKDYNLRMFQEGPRDRPASESDRLHTRAGLAKAYLSAREQAGGRADPLFFSSDHEAMAKMNPDHFGVVEARHGGDAKGYQVNGMSEWRSWSGRPFSVKQVE